MALVLGGRRRVAVGRRLPGLRPGRVVVWRRARPGCPAARHRAPRCVGCCHVPASPPPVASPQRLADPAWGLPVVVRRRGRRPGARGCWPGPDSGWGSGTPGLVLPGPPSPAEASPAGDRRGPDGVGCPARPGVCCGGPAERYPPGRARFAVRTRPGPRTPPSVVPAAARPHPAWGRPVPAAAVAVRTPRSRGPPGRSLPGRQPVSRCAGGLSVPAAPAGG